MATIAATLNAASPGTQADNVTTDANLTYKVYNDTDSYATAEAFGKHGTTGVTVAAGVVTITGVTEPVGVTAYKISSVDEAGNESVLSDASSSSIIIYDYDFASTTTDDQAPNYVRILNQDPTKVTFAQNDVMVMDVIAASSSGVNFLQTPHYLNKIPAPISTVSFDLMMDKMTPVNGIYQFNIADNSGDWYFGFVKNTSSGQDGVVHALNMFNGGNDDNTTLINLDLTGSMKTIKFETDGSTYTDMQLWNGTSWDIIYTTPFGYSVDAYMQFQTAAGSTNFAHTITIDNVYMTNDTFTTQYPT